MSQKTIESQPQVNFAKLGAYTSQDWMSKIDDSISLKEINIPGTHDSASLFSLWPPCKPCYCNQNRNITEQLNGGIRLLDVRLKTIKESGKPYRIVTCHGTFLGKLGYNEFQSFPSLIDECKNFLLKNKEEAIIMILGVDDWDGNGNDKENIFNSLSSILNTLPSGMIYTSKDLPTLKDVRGKIILFNSFTDGSRFGTLLSFPNAELIKIGKDINRNFDYHIQNKYDEISGNIEEEKAKLVISAFKKKNCGEMVMNFASIDKRILFLPARCYLIDRILNYFGQTNSQGRLSKFGWTFFDYIFEEYTTDRYGRIDIVKIIIASNFAYQGYEDIFKVI